MGYGNLKGELELKYLKKIGNTSIDNYISGYYALNLPDKDGIIADWHPRQYWYSLKKTIKSCLIQIISLVLKVLNLGHR